MAMFKIAFMVIIGAIPLISLFGLTNAWVLIAAHSVGRTGSHRDAAEAYETV